MSRIKEFLDKYPRPWTFVETDRDGSGRIHDADGHPLVILKADRDYNDEDPEAVCEVFCPNDSSLGVDQDMWDERNTLIDILLGESDDEQQVE